MKKSRMILLVAITGVAVGVGILCATRWKAWFGQPEEAPYTVSPTPWRVMLTFGNDGEFSRMLSWQCDSIAQPAHVELMGPDSVIHITPAIGEVFASRAGKACYYRVALDSLTPGCDYAYRVVTADKPSDWYSLRLQADKPGRDFAFIYIGDLQDSIGGHANQNIRDIASRNPDAEFMIFGGDFAERPRDIDWQQAFTATDSVRQNLSILNVTGNHDYLKSIPAKLERRFALVFPYFLDSKVDDNMTYSLRYGDAEFFLLDSFREYPYLLSQADWLAEKIGESTAKWKVVVMHHPLYSIRGKNNLTQKWAFLDIIEENGVDLVLQAHEHN